MKKKFNEKTYLGSKRIEKSIQGNPNITKLWHWNTMKACYEVNPNAKSYISRRKRIVDGRRVTQKLAFYSLTEARSWQHEAEAQPKEQVTVDDSPTFSLVVNDYRKNRFTTLKVSTQNLYDRLMKSKNWEILYNFKINEITPVTIDQWIKRMKSNPHSSTRTSFKKELSLLKTILTYYSEYDDKYQLPFKVRHKKDIVVRAKEHSKNKDLTQDQFQRFRQELLKGKMGLMIYTLATVQYYQALRISEAAGIHAEDIILNQHKELSRLKVSKSVMYDSNKRGILQNSFKNSNSNHGSKESPLFPESYFAIQKYFETYKDRKGALFIQDNGELLTYRQIQHAYDKAFRLAGLNFSGTHIMRHGGARLAYDSSNGDFGVAKQILGNADIKSIQIYAQRSTSALNEHSEKIWKKHLEVVTGGVPQNSTDTKIKE